jgi:hypothetical protein
MVPGKREKHEQHGIGVPRQRDEMIYARPPFACKPVFAVRSLAPVHRIAILIARWVEPSSEVAREI